jgi:hypothetical protein
MEKTRTKTCSDCGTAGCQSGSSNCPKQTIWNIMGALLKNAKLKGTITHRWECNGELIEGTVTGDAEDMWKWLMNGMSQNEQARTEFILASTHKQIQNKRLAGELEVENIEQLMKAKRAKEDREAQLKRQQEDNELAAHLDALKKQAFFGDEASAAPASAAPDAAPASDAGRSEDEVHPAPAASTVRQVFGGVLGGAAAAVGQHAIKTAFGL